MSRRVLLPVTVAALVVVSCSGDQATPPTPPASPTTASLPPTTTTTTPATTTTVLATTTTSSVEQLAVTYTDAGPFPVGVTTLALAKGPAVVEVWYPAAPGASGTETYDGRDFFSHGFSGFRLQSTFLTSHLASWGMIVVAPDHPSRDLTNVLSNTATGEVADAVDDLLAGLDLLTAAVGVGPEVAAAYATPVTIEVK